MIAKFTKLRVWIALAILSLAFVAYAIVEVRKQHSIEEQSVSAIEELHGTIKRRFGIFGPVVRVDLSGMDIADDDLVHLKALSRLGVLVLSSKKVTDAGLVHLTDLTQLRRLVLTRTQVTDEGLVHLKGLTQLQFLHLNG